MQIVRRGKYPILPRRSGDPRLPCPAMSDRGARPPWWLLAGGGAAPAALLLVATAPFAVRYATEARMYSLMVLLSIGGYLALLRVLRAPGTGPVVGLALISGLLLLTHYWGLYLLATAGFVLLLRRREPGARRALVGLAAGGLLFAPWLPAFAFQLRHTGTPWAEP